MEPGEIYVKQSNKKKYLVGLVIRKGPAKNTLKNISNFSFQNFKFKHNFWALINTERKNL